MTDLPGLIIPLEARVDRLEKGLQRANRMQRRSAQQMERRAKESARRLERTYEKMGDRVGAGFKRMAGPLLAGVASVQTVRQLAATTKAVARLGDEAKQAGVPLKDFQEWKFVAEQNRIGIDAMVDGLKELNLRADEFVLTGKGPAAEAFDRLGYGAEELKQKLENPSELLLEIVGRMERMSTAARIRVADEVFGGSAGERFVQLVDRGEDGLRETVNRAHELGLVLDESVVARADELDRKFDALLSKVATFGKRVAVATADIGAQIADNVASVADGPDPLAPLNRSYDQLAERARAAGMAMLQSVGTLNAFGYGAIANDMRELSDRAFDLASGFEDGTVEAEDFAQGLEAIQGEAATALDRLEDVDRASFNSVIGALAGLARQLATTLGVAASLKRVLDSIDGAGTGGAPNKGNLFRQADAESRRTFERDQQRQAEFLAGEAKRNSLSQERLDLEREATAVQKAAADAGAILTRQQAETAAQARLDAASRRDEAAAAARDAANAGGGGSSGGGGSASTSDWQSEIDAIAQETQALRMEALELQRVTDAQIRRGDAMDLARTKAELLSAALRSGLSETPALRAQINGMAQEYIDASQSAELAADRIREVQEASARGANSIANVFEGMATGALTAKEAVGRLILEIIKLSLRKRILEASENAGGFFGGFLKILGGGFSEGGWTGPGAKYEPAGVVHRDEYVFPKQAVRKIGVDRLAGLHKAALRGYADGGLVGAQRTLTGRSGASRTDAIPAIHINAPVTVNGSAGTPDQNQDLANRTAREMERSMRGVVVDELRKQMRNGNMLSKVR